MPGTNLFACKAVTTKAVTEGLIKFKNLFCKYIKRIILHNINSLIKCIMISELFIVLSLSRDWDSGVLFLSCLPCSKFSRFPTPTGWTLTSPK